MGFRGYISIDGTGHLYDRLHGLFLEPQHGLWHMKKRFNWNSSDDCDSSHTHLQFDLFLLDIRTLSS